MEKGEGGRAVIAGGAPGLAARAVLLAALAGNAGADGPAPQGSAFNRGGLDPALERDARGMSPFAAEPSRTPEGRLYDPPFEPRAPLPLANGWDYRLSVELGAVHGSSGAPRIRDYGDFRNGAVLNHFSLGLEEAGQARWFDFTAGAVGRDDQHYRASFGRRGDFRASLYFNELPKLFTDRARSVFLGAGGGNLALVPGLVPGGNTAAQVEAALQGAPFFDLGFTRKTAGLDFESTPGSDWRFYARYSQDRKDGTRPSGSASSYPGVPVAELIEPIDYRTHNVAAGMQWSGETVQANLGYSGSFFRNGIDTLTWENPVRVGNPAVLQRGRMDLYPDNGSHNLRLDWSAALPARARLNGGLSWGRMTQDDPLVAPTVNAGTLGADNLANWNTAAALGQPSANARIDTLLYHLGGAFSPLPDLSVQARARRYEEDNRTRYTAYNPLTGQFGYMGLDGANNANIVPGLFRVPLYVLPYERSRDNYTVEGDYRLLRRTNVTLGYERERILDPRREYARTDEGRWRLGLNNRDVAWATVRLSYERAERSGDRYDPDPNRALYSVASLVNAPATLAQLRKYDVADRRQQVLNGRVNFLVARDMDLAVSARWRDDDYDAAYGRLAERRAALNLEWNWQPAPRSSAWAHYGFERLLNRMATINDDPAGWGTGDPNAGGAVYPLANRWDAESRDDAHHVGLGFRHAFPRATWEAGYFYIYSPYRAGYRYASPGALASGATAAATAADGMPAMAFRQQVLETSLKFALARETALRLYYRFERTRVEDWHYDGLPLVLGSEGIFLGAGPRSYTDHLFGVFFQYTPGKRPGHGGGK